MLLTGIALIVIGLAILAGVWCEKADRRDFSGTNDFHNWDNEYEDD